ncbi:putative RWD [Escovopsis weberi]|uniref:Putative RWD n=1 Tax=Escovopsis weberi TaxID=150374 RepID=A0A0M9VVN9_ESCWE|nr:putative RWD [Escovopsis weberi]
MTGFDELSDAPKKGSIIKSAYDSESFEADGTIHVEGVVGSATISPSGRDIALASPEGLAIIDLDSPYSPPRRLRSPGMPWLVVDVQWSPFAARDYWVVSTANHRALVWNLSLRDDSSTGAIEHTLQGHSRAITDVNFSAHHPDFLATCSVDGYVHWWDLRRPRQPVLTFCDWFAGATQVKYNRRDPHILASSHDRCLHIWDERNPSKPMKTITAHSSKIYGLDWNRTNSHGIVTCSLDQSIKFWDTSREGDDPEHVINTGFPVWRARHTPFGYGLLAMPQNAPGDLYLYDRLWCQDKTIEAAQQPVAVFDGHGEYKAKEFLWRSRGGITDDDLDMREFQLVSWGTDNELRLHCIDANILQSVGYKKGQPAGEGLSLTRSGAIYRTFRAIDDHATRDRRTGTMKDPRQGLGDIRNNQHSALTVGMRSLGSYNLNRHTRSAWRGPSMKAKVITRKSLDKSQAQIGWMKGITIAKRKASTNGRRLMPKDSNMLGPAYPDDQWVEPPETIQEELLRISTQIPKVKWENIDMDSLTLTASLNGPWGKDAEVIFLRVKIDIPPNYPKVRAPKFSIEKTSFIPEAKRKRLEKELHQVAEKFLQNRKNCLEVVFTYLLGEVDLEASTNFFKNVRDLDDDVLVDDSSSEEDEDIPAGGSASMSQELIPHTDNDTMVATPAHIIIPPPPLTCGARFSADGRLVCFFPTKEEKARALFQTTAELCGKDRAKGEPIFAGFGRLAHDPPSRRKYTTDDASATEDQSDSEESDESSSSSSDSESTSIHKMSLWYHTSHQFRDTYSEDISIRSSGGGTGTGIGTATGTGTGRRRPGRPRNIVSIHDLRADLPSKKEFAQEYAIFGDGAVICKHNASVAAKYGYTDLQNIWLYLALLLRKGIPLELLASNQRRGSILVIAREAVSRLPEEEKRDLLLDVEDELGSADNTLFGRVKWGRHPLAKDFIQELFDHYEKIVDIQMLAMLSCIFSECSTDDSVAYVESQLPQQDTPLPLKAPSFSLGYIPTDATMWNIYGQRALYSVATTPGILHTPAYYAGSHASDDMTWGGEAGANSFSCGETPPSKGRSWIEPPETPFNLLSKSPTNRSLSRITGSAINAPTSAFPTNIPRSFNGSSSSPPLMFKESRKKPSPAEAMMMSSLTPRPGYASPKSSSLYPTFGDAPTGRTSAPDGDYRREDLLPLVPVSVSVFVEDQTAFDDDGWLTTPLLDASRASTYANYRYAYAEMLQMWGQPLARLEVMKFNVLKEDQSAGQEGSFHDSFTLHDGASGGASHPKSASSPIIMGRKDHVQMLVASGRGLDITGVCSVHEMQLDPVRYTSSESKLGGAVGTCDRCRRVQNQLRCVYCLEPVDALFPPCLSCGCVSHEECLAEWHAAGETFCPAGDECNCVDEAVNGLVESWAALRGTVMMRAQATDAHADALPEVTSRASLDADSRSLKLAGRSRSRGHSQAHSHSRVGRLPPALDSEGEGDLADEEANEKAGEWERVGKDVPSRAQGEGAPGLSFVRFKNTAQTWSRASSQRRSGLRGAGT